MPARDPEATRDLLLHAAYDEVYRNGVAGTSVDAVLARTRMTKGALYHHFEGKKALCRAVIDEVVRPKIVAQWVEPLRDTSDPVGALQAVLRRVVKEPPERALDRGCPLNNLAQEVSGTDEDLRADVQQLYELWIGGVRDALRRGQRAGTVRDDVDAEKAANFVVGAIEGALTLGKTSRSAAVLGGNLEVLGSYLESLRPSPARTRRR